VRTRFLPRPRVTADAGGRPDDVRGRPDGHFHPKTCVMTSLPKTAKICQNLPKDETWNSSKNQDFSVFPKIKICTYRGGIKAYFLCLDFQSKNFHMLFSLLKNGLCMWISAYPLVEIDDFLKVPHLVWAWDFVDMYLTNPKTRIWSPSIDTYSKKWFFWAPKLCRTPWALGKQLFFSTLNLTILQTVWNECVRFGRHVNIQVSYKIL
jgi:hypothetical protein